MTSSPLGWAGFKESDNPVIRAFGLGRLLAIGVFSMALEGVLSGGDHRAAIAVMAMGVMLAHKGLELDGLSSALRLSAADIAQGSADGSRAMTDLVALMAIALWLAYAAIQLEWLSDGLRAMAILLTATHLFSGNRAAMTYAMLSDSLDSLSAAHLRPVWHEVKKFAIRASLLWMTILGLGELVRLLARLGGSADWYVPGIFMALFIAVLVVYQFAAVAIFGRSVVHALASERVVVAGIGTRSRLAAAALRSVSFNAPLIATGLLLALDVLFVGEKPGLDAVFEVMGTLALIWYGSAYFHRDRRAPHDIAAGTMVVRTDLSLAS